jgi:post-segregation antitoxin (ccd killing protein)
MNITEFREQYPQYAAVDDDTLARKVHAKYYPTVSYEEFADRFLPKTVFSRLNKATDTLKQAAEEVKVEEPKRATPVDLGLPFKRLPGGIGGQLATKIEPGVKTQAEQLREIRQTPGPAEVKDELTRQYIHGESRKFADTIQSSIQRPYDAARWQAEAELLKGKFLSKNYRRWERGSTMMVGGGLHLAEELTRLTTLGRKGDTLADWADIYSDVLKTPEMQPVIETALDQYLGGAIETAPFLASTLVPGLGAKAFASVPRIASAIEALTPAANFLTTYGVESNLVYQGLKDQGEPEETARARSVIAGIVNAGIELRGGSGDKYLKQNVVKVATTKLGKYKYFSRKVLRTALTEGLAEELPQEVVSMVLGKDTPRRADGKIDWAKTADRMIDVAVAGTLLGGLVASPMIAATAAKIPSIVKDEVVATGPDAVTIPGRTYLEATQRAESEVGGKNPWVKQERSKTNKNRVLLVQFSSDLLTEGKEYPVAKAYYDKLYASRPGYARLGDTWEVPKWITEASNFVPGSDVYFVRDVDEAKRFLKSSGYGKIMFSALDINAPLIKDLAENFKGKVVVGGYGENKAMFEEVPNAVWYDSMPDMAKGEGYAYKPGVNLSHFEGSPTIPRLCMSKGCKHKCAFCVVTKEFEETGADLIQQQVDAFADLDAKLVYLDDKTFGQAKNHTMLPDLYWRIKEKNPEFDGFVIQTTASQFAKFSDVFITDAHIRYVEFGVESFNDSILKELHKPHNEERINEAVAKARRLKINVIPNVIIGLPQETAETYSRTIDWLEANADVISHVNAYNLALYAGTEITQKTVGDTPIDERDLNETVAVKSFHKDPKLHSDFSAQLYDFSSRMLDKGPIGQTGLTADQVIAQQYGVEPGRVEIIFKQAEDRYRELKAMKTKDRSKADKEELALLSRSRNDIEVLLADITSAKSVTTLKLKAEEVSTTRSKEELTEIGHGAAQQLGMSEEERRAVMVSMTGKNSMKSMDAGEMEQYVQYLEEALKERGEKYEPQSATFYEMLDQLHNLKRPDRIMGTGKLSEELKNLWDGLQKVAWEFTRLDRFFEWLDGGDTNGWFKKTFYRPMVSGNSGRNQGIDHDVYSLDDFVKGLGANPGTMISRVDKITDTISLSASQRIGEYMLWQNEHGREHLEATGRTQRDMDDIVAFMDDIEVRIAEYMLDYYKNFWPIIRQIALSVGIKEEDLVQEYMYSPIVVTDRHGSIADNQADILDFFMDRSLPTGAGAERKFLEKRRGPGRNEHLETDAFVLFFSMANRLNSFVNMAPIAYSVNKMLHDDVFKASLNEATNGIGVRIVDSWVKHAVRGHGDRSNQWAVRALLALRDSGTFYAIGFNIPSVMRQAVGTFNTLSANPKAWRHYASVAVRAMTGGFKDLHKEVATKSEFVRHRSLEEVLRKGWSREELIQRFGRKFSPSDISMRALREMDLRSVVTAWQALYQMQKEAGATEQEAITYAEEWMAKTQEISDVVYLPDIMRSGAAATGYKLLAPFTNAVNNQLNLYLYDNWEPVKRGGTKGLPLTAYRFAMTWWVPALLFGMIGRGRFQDDPGEVAEDLITYPVATLLTVGDMIQYAITGESKRGELYEMGGLSAADTVRAAMKGNVGGVLKNAARTVAIIGGAIHPRMRGAITAQTVRTVEAAYDLAFAEEKPPVKSLVIGKYAAEKSKQKEEEQSSGRIRR